MPSRSYEREITEEMESLYQREDPWEYRKSSRHSYTVEVCQRYWQGGSILEIGCGEGLLLRKLGEMSPSPACVIGYEVSATAIRRAEENLKDLSCPSSLRRGNVLRGDIQWFPVNLIVLSDVLPYLVGVEGENAGFVEDWLVRLWDEGVVPGGSLVVTSWDTDYRFDVSMIVPKAASAICWGEGDRLTQCMGKDPIEYAIFSKGTR